MTFRIISITTTTRFWRYGLFLGLIVLLLPGGWNSSIAQNGLAATSSQPIERGTFRLHRRELPVGEERYEVTREGEALVIRSTFEYSDRNVKVPLSATLRMRQDLTPLSFSVKGKTSRHTDTDVSIEINGLSAAVREGKVSRQVVLPDRYFTINGYAPMSVQMALMRYWIRKGSRGTLMTLPGGEVSIERRGRDVVKVGTQLRQLDRYSIKGVIWGYETVWLDPAQRLAAVVTVNAEHDEFEAIGEDYESALPFFVARAAADRMAALASLAGRMKPQRKGPLAIVGGTLVDGTGKPAVPNVVVVVKEGHIVAVGPRSGVKIPKGASVVDARGKTLLPGLWEMHTHFNQVEWGPIYLAAGITTARDCGNEFEFITAARSAIRSGRGIGPHLLLAGLVDGEGESGNGVIRADTPAEGRAVVHRYRSAGFDQMKIYNLVKPEVLRSIVDEAHGLGMTVTGHVPVTMSAFQAVEAGMDQINHVTFVARAMIPEGDRSASGEAFMLAVARIDLESPQAKQVIEFFKEHGTVIDVTIARSELAWHSKITPVESFEPGIAKVAPELAPSLNSTGVSLAPSEAEPAFRKLLAIVGALHKAGVTIVAGTDGGTPGHSLYRELELYVRAGFTPMEAIQAATVIPARVMKLDKGVGTIEVGKRADMIIVDGNPLENISNIRKVRFVVSRGQIYESAPLWQSVGFQP